MRIARSLILSVATVLSALSFVGCTQTNTTTISPAESPDQALWAQYTADADKARNQGNQQEAERLYKLAMEEAEKLGASSPGLARAVSNMANFYYAQGDGDRADRLYQQAISIKEKALGAEHVDIAEDLIGLGRVRLSQGRKSEALPLFQRAANILTKANKPVPPEVSKELSGTAGDTKRDGN